MKHADKKGVKQTLSNLYYKLTSGLTNCYRYTAAAK